MRLPDLGKVTVTIFRAREGYSVFLAQGQNDTYTAWTKRDTIEEGIDAAFEIIGETKSDMEAAA